MKNLIKLLLISFVGLLIGITQTFGQSAQNMTGNGDTITNSGTKTNTLKVTSDYGKISIQSVVTRLSGTAGGTITLQVSNDGSNWVSIDTGAVVSKKYTYTVTNTTTQSTMFTIYRPAYLYYRVSYTGTGTMSCRMSSYLIARKEW